MDASGQVLHDGDSQEAVVGDSLHYEQRLDVHFLPPEVHNELLGLWCLEEQDVNSTPHHQSLHLISVVELIPPRDEPHYRGVICEFDEGAAGVCGDAVMGVEGVEQGTQHAALLGASAESKEPWMYRGPLWPSRCGLSESP